MARSDRLLRQHFRSRVLVTLKTGEAFDGVLIEADEAHYILADSSLVAADGSQTSIDGQLWVRRPDVAYMQVPVVPVQGWLQ